MNRNVERLRLLLGLAVALVGTLGWSTASAQDALLVLVTEETVDEADVQRAFWWESGASPAWSPTDLALREALTASGAGFAEPTTLGSLSKIYRRPAPSDANAAAMASVFGRSRVLVGTVRYEPAQLRPMGLVGWNAEVSLRLVEKGASGADVLKRVDFARARWALSDEEAREALRGEIATTVAAAVAAGIVRNAGPVGLDADELMVGVAAPSTRQQVDAVREKLASLAGVTAVQERWAAEGIIVLEVNPGVVDPRASVEQYVSLLTTEGAGTFRAVPTQSRWDNVVVVRLEERAP